MQLILHPAAERELDDALRHSHAKFGPHVVQQFRRRIEQAGELLMRDPGMGTRAPGGARMLALGRYPYTLVYKVTGTTLHVLALMHQSRKPGYWRGRG